MLCVSDAVQNTHNTDRQTDRDHGGSFISCHWVKLNRKLCQPSADESSCSIRVAVIIIMCVN